MIVTAQLRGAQALLAFDRRRLAGLSGPCIQTMPWLGTSETILRGSAGSLTKPVSTLHEAGIECLAPGTIITTGGRGVRLTELAVDNRLTRPDANVRDA